MKCTTINTIKETNTKEKKHISLKIICVLQNRCNYRYPQASEESAADCRCKRYVARS